MRVNKVCFSKTEDIYSEISVMPYGTLSYLDTLSNFPEQQVNKIKLWKPIRSYFSYSPNRSVAGWYFFPFLTSVI